MIPVGTVQSSQPADSTPEGADRSEAWHRMATRSAAEIRARFEVPDRNAEERIVRVFRAALRPRSRGGGSRTRRPPELLGSGSVRWKVTPS